ncbi:MAG TPA: DUF3592 domain-containing protein [Terracidiphilus sp.]|nr:DUF3592 domain-containing protein [Terracidiphilus sp.]
MDIDDVNRATAAPPGELVGPLPRKVELCSTDGQTFLGIALLFFVIGVVFAISFSSEAIQQTRQRAILHGAGRDVVGEVTGFSVGRWAPTVVKYQFSFNGKTYFGSAKEPRTTGTGIALKKSDQILVRFLPSNPSINHPETWEWSVLMGLDSLALQVFLFTISVIGIAALMRDRKLARKGKAVSGVVIRCTPRNREFQVEYEFRTEDGFSMRGKCGCADSYEAGARIWILYLPHWPQRNHCYPLAYYCVVD